MSEVSVSVSCSDLPIMKKIVAYLEEAMESPFVFHDEGREYNTCRWCGTVIVLPCKSLYGDANSHTSSCLVSRMRADGLLD